MKLVVFSDIHYCPKERYDNGFKRKLTECAESLTKKLIKKINEIKPDAVIILGDSIEDLKDSDLDKTNLKKIYSIIKTIDVPYYLLAGNHDLRTLSNDDFKEIVENKESTFSKDIKGYHLVFLGLNSNNDLSENNGGILKTRELPKEDIEWLKNDLSVNSLPTLVFIHFGLAEDSMVGNWWFEEQPEDALLQNRNEVKKILEQNGNILAVFSGHQHWTKTIIEKEIPYHTIGSLVENIDFTGKPDGVWFLVDVDKNGLKIIEQHLD